MNELIIPFLQSSMVCLVWLKICQYLKNQNLISSEVSRKFIHIGTGVLFVLVWQLFPQFNWYSRIVAGLIPLLISFQFSLIGLGFIHDPKTVNSMSRTGSPRELLLGPLSYGFIITFLAMFYWFESPIGIITTCILCFGDGFAAIMGSKYGKIKVPYNKEKTIVGSISFIFFSFIGTFIVLRILETSLLYPAILLIPSLASVCIITSLVESLPLKDWDNITISLVSVLTLTLMGY